MLSARRTSASRRCPILRFEEPAQRFHAAHDHEQVVLSRQREDGVDQVVTRALVAQVNLQPVSEKSNKIANRPEPIRAVSTD